jgi:hypothetical protein
LFIVSWLWQAEAGGNGGNIGKKNFNRGGDNDGGDDGGLFGGRLAVPEVTFTFSLFVVYYYSSSSVMNLSTS